MTASVIVAVAVSVTTVLTVSMIGTLTLSVAVTVCTSVLVAAACVSALAPTVAVAEGESWSRWTVPVLALLSLSCAACAETVAEALAVAVAVAGSKLPCESTVMVIISVLVLSVVDVASPSESWWCRWVLVWPVENSSVWDCAAALVEVWRVVGTTEFASGVADPAAIETDSAAAAAAAATVAEGSEDRVETKTELKSDSDESADEADAVLTKTGVPVRLIGMTVRPPEEMSVVMVEADAAVGFGLEDNASADALAGIVDGAAEPVTVRTPVSLADGVEDAESVLGWGGMTIVSDACDECTAGADAEAAAEALEVSEAEAEGGNGEAWIEDKPLEMSALVDVSCVVAASVTVIVLVVETSVSVLMGIEVRPGSTVLVFVTVNKDSLNALVVAALSADVEADDVLSAIELSPLTTLSATVCAAAVPLAWFCCAVSLSVVYPPMGPLKVGEAVTKIMVMLLGDGALDSAASAEAELLAEAVEEDDSEFDCELLEAAAIEKPASELDAELLAVSEGGNAAVTCIVVSTVTMFVVCVYTVAISGCAVCDSETAAGDVLAAPKAGTGTICVEAGSGVGAATAPVPSCRFRMLWLWSLTIHLLCSSLARRRTFLLLLLSMGPAEDRAARRNKLASEICIFGLLQLCIRLLSV